jgi:hypothetical protein
VTDILSTLLPGGGAAPDPFPPDSRYHGLPICTITVDGRELRYLSRRLVPPADSFAEIGVHVVQDGERPDTVAALVIGNAELWWSICDANDVLHPADLTAEIGRRVRVTLPSGIPGPGSLG